ncbi:MAG: 4'-phosphopantetheinyl transferase superfamily protein [Draconibacterium sp.]|nr:4'-phosphopantetheinyl transferase superfamily protein [Draconibacterium sp.]
MPIIDKKITEAGVLGIWKLTETVPDLMSIFQFSEIEKEEFIKIKVDRRKIEYIATRLLLKELINIKPEINYLESGKPELTNIQRNITISHSSDFVVVLVSENKIGIDVENTQRNIKKIANRFLCKEELEYIQKTNDTQTATILYWSAKEAIFKCTDKDGVIFDKQIYIHPFNIKREGKFFGTLNKITHFELWYFFIENNVIVYCVE